MAATFVRLAIALVVLGLAVSGAVYLHQREVLVTRQECLPLMVPNDHPNCILPSTELIPAHPSWQDPVALLLLVGGVAAAASLVTRRPRALHDAVRRRAHGARATPAAPPT